MERLHGAVDYFIVFLVGGLVLLFALASFFSFTEPLDQGISTIPAEESLTSYNFEFDISKLREEKSFYLGDFDLLNGFLFKRQDLKYSITSEDVIELRISFNVSGGNFYLPLVVKVNGNKIVNKPLFDGQYQFIVKNVSSEMLIEMKTESSSWRLWAPSLYKVKDIRFDLGSFSDVSKEFKFNVSTNVEKITRGNIDFTFQENEGIFILELNNYVIFRDAINDFQSVEVNKESFIAGINELTLRADDNSRFIGSAVMAVIFGSV